MANKLKEIADHDDEEARISSFFLENYETYFVRSIVIYFKERTEFKQEAVFRLLLLLCNYRNSLMYRKMMIIIIMTTAMMRTKLHELIH